MKGMICLFFLLLGTFTAVELASAWQDPASYDIAFIGFCGDPGQQGFCRMHSDGSQPSLMFRASDILLQPNWWSPDGRKIIYCAGSNFFHLAYVDGSKDEELPIKLFGLDIQMVWSPDSTRLAFASPFEDPNVNDPEVRRNHKLYSTAIYVMDVQTKKVGRLSPLGQNRWISWSPDSRGIVYSGTDPGEVKGNIYVVDSVVGVGGARPRSIFTGATNNVLPIWSPKGNQIAFLATPMGGKGADDAGLYIVRPDGSAPRRIQQGYAAGAWSPDGRFLLIGSQIVNVGTGATLDLDSDGNKERTYDATFAPDGRSIIYRTSDQARGTISAIDVDGKNRRKLIDIRRPGFAVSPLLGR
jgi:Tol biopolymer transport system component